MSEKLRIAEMFTSLQGEGGLVGVPSAFIRVSGCNLRCVWCDTPYASWSPEGPVMGVEDILDWVHQSGIRHVVLTGGEPIIFDAIEPLCRGIRAQGRHITIETAGTVFREVECDLMSISPKLSHSTPPESDDGWRARHEALRLNLPVLTDLLAHYDSQLKFVVNPDQLQTDLDEIDAILGSLPIISPDRVLLMAEGIDSATQVRRMRALVPVCLERGWRLTPRLHIDLFGNQRGT
jgi:7-carboxy-7-deazaguanine synthase